MQEIINKLICSGHNCINDDFFNKNFKMGIVTHCSYKGLSMEQNPNVIFALEELFNTIRPDLVIEIGTFHGGLTLMMRDILNYKGLNSTNLITYDVSTPNFLMRNTSSNEIDIRVKNLFSDDYLSWRSSDDKKEIQDLIMSNKKVIVMCDGGSKKNEFRLISDLIKTGDVIMAHDYSPNEEYFKNTMYGKMWNWMEINDNDINHSSMINNLTPFIEKSFLDVAWVCKIKD
jgi:cephalosporin hydroxylase